MNQVIAMPNSSDSPKECECCPITQAQLTLKHGVNLHGKPNQKLGFKFGMWLCPDCLEKEIKAQADLHNPVAAEARVAEARAIQDKQLNINQMADKAKLIDSSIQVRTDLFNAETVAIVDVFNSIDADVAIENKPLAKAQFMLERFTHFKTVVFELNEKVVEATTRQRAYQQQLNAIANQLRQEERDKLKLADINYKPSTPKIVKTRVAKSSSAKVSKSAVKYDRKEIQRVANEIGITEFTLQMICVSKQLSPADAGAFLKKQMDDNKAN